MQSYIKMQDYGASKDLKILKNRIAYAGIRHLNMQHTAHTRCNICHGGRMRSGTRSDAPTHEYQWDMTVVRVPKTMVCAFIVGT